MRKTLKTVVAEYGTVALFVYMAIFLAVLAGIWTAIRLGWQPESTTSNMGTFAAAYFATKLTQPLRIAATLALTPLAAKVYERMSRKAARP